MNGAVIAYSLGLAILLTAAQVLFKTFASLRAAQAGIDLQQLIPLAGALTLYFLVFVLYAYALRKFDLSLLYPTYTALSVLFTYIAGVVIFREQFSLRAVVGCVLLVASIYLLATPKK